VIEDVEGLSCRWADGVLRLTLDRPEKRNALRFAARTVHDLTTTD
jgi:enoyl-CoA hydratase